MPWGKARVTNNQKILMLKMNMAGSLAYKKSFRKAVIKQMGLLVGQALIYLTATYYAQDIYPRIVLFVTAIVCLIFMGMNLSVYLNYKESFDKHMEKMKEEIHGLGQNERPESTK